MTAYTTYQLDQFVADLLDGNTLEGPFREADMAYIEERVEASGDAYLQAVIRGRKMALTVVSL